MKHLLPLTIEEVKYTNFNKYNIWSKATGESVFVIQLENKKLAEFLVTAANNFYGLLDLVGRLMYEDSSKETEYPNPPWKNLSETAKGAWRQMAIAQPKAHDE